MSDSECTNTGTSYQRLRTMLAFRGWAQLPTHHQLPLDDVADLASYLLQFKFPAAAAAASADQGTPAYLQNREKPMLNLYLIETQNRTTVGNPNNFYLIHKNDLKKQLILGESTAQSKMSLLQISCKKIETL